MSEKIYSIEEIKEILYKLLKNTPVVSVVLFGSYAKNLQTKKSDIDIVIDSEGKLLNIVNIYHLLLHSLNYIY